MPFETSLNDRQLERDIFDVMTSSPDENKERIDELVIPVIRTNCIWSEEKKTEKLCDALSDLATRIRAQKAAEADPCYGSSPSFREDT